MITLFSSLWSYAGNNEGAQKSNGNIEAYYFHYNTRCVTCITVEEQAKIDIETLYPKMIKEGSISFRAINLDEPSGKVLGEKLKVSGQTLLLVKGNKKINITNEGFLYAVSNPVKLKSIIRQKIDSLLEL